MQRYRHRLNECAGVIGHMTAPTEAETVKPEAEILQIPESAAKESTKVALLN